MKIKTFHYNVARWIEGKTSRYFIYMLQHVYLDVKNVMTFKESEIFKKHEENWPKVICTPNPSPVFEELFFSWSNHIDILKVILVHHTFI